MCVFDLTIQEINPSSTWLYEFTSPPSVNEASRSPYLCYHLVSSGFKIFANRIDVIWYFIVVLIKFTWLQSRLSIYSYVCLPVMFLIYEICTFLISYWLISSFFTSSTSFIVLYTNSLQRFSSSLWFLKKSALIWWTVHFVTCWRNLLGNNILLYLFLFFF